MIIDARDNMVIWKGERTWGNEQRSGVLYDDPKLLFGPSLDDALSAVRESVEIVLIPVLGTIDDLEEVLNSQVLQAVRDLRRNHGLVDE